MELGVDTLARGASQPRSCSTAGAGSAAPPPSRSTRAVAPRTVLSAARARGHAVTGNAFFLGGVDFQLTA